MSRRMNHRPSRSFPAFAAALAMTAATVSFGVAAKDKSEPFVATAHIYETLAVPSGDGNCTPTEQHPGVAATGTITGSGLSNVIGPFDVSSYDCIRSDVPGQFSPPFTFGSSTFTLITANGDTLVASYDGKAELNSLGLLVLDGNYKITGGTGQFHKAKGKGTLTGVENIGTAPATGFVTLTGQIKR